MSRNDANAKRDTLTLSSTLSEISRIPPWLESLASRDGIPERIRFGMDLCLEEVLSNIVRHGYADAPNHTILVIYTNPRKDTFTLVVEDQAPQFNPLLVRDELVPRSLEEIAEGGQGIYLLKRFADALDYESTPTGNRLTISFIVPEFMRAVP
jgi:serine/threonine-protein kinase RsbW